MLPFFVRDSRRKKAKKRRRDEVDDGGGGPVQIAITKDLIDLRNRFRERLLERKEEGCPLPPSLWKPGSAFAIFKGVFGSSKIAMLHLLPPARTDREAYSQLIYGACFALLKESFGRIRAGTMGESTHGEVFPDIESADHFSDAVFAIFLLLALFETNPLPREIDNENPLHLLPIGSRANDDGRIPNRRCFKKNIRIDQEHYVLMLRLKELALARRSDCERLFFKLRSLALQHVESDEGQKASGSHTEPWVSIQHAMASDIITVLERIFPRLELCEYTGPLSAEGFAGHDEYPHKTAFRESDCPGKTTSCLQTDSDTTRKIQSTRIETSNGESEELMSLFQTYKNSVNEIRIPASKSNRVRRVQDALQPLFSQIKSIQSVQSQQYNGSNSSNFQIESYPDDLESERNHGVYRVSLDTSIKINLKKALHASVMALLARDDLLLPLSGVVNDHSKTTLDPDDVSSIGHGGISIATGIVRPGGLRSSNGKNTRSKKSRFTNPRRAATKQDLATNFLTSKQSASSDEASVDSEVTLSSFSDTDSVEEDEVSVATSAFGKKALSDLLKNVTQDETNIQKKRSNNKGRQVVKGVKKQNNKKQRAKALLPSSNDNEQDELISTATSAFGKRALEDLLKHVDKKADGVTEAKKPRSKKQKPTVSQPEANTEEEISVATSAFGKRALDQLLQNAGKANNDDRKDEKKRRTKKEVPKTSTLEVNAEDISVATSTFGKKALDDLLQKADQEVDNIQKRTTNKRKTRNQKPKQLPYPQPKNHEDETSVATSAFGKRALEDLLQNMSEDQD